MGANAATRLSAEVTGAVVQPGEAEYEDARTLWNGVIDRRPALIVQCGDVADVQAAVNFARDNALPLAVRGGGHNVAGMATVDGGVVVDLSRMRRVVVDPDQRKARAEGGVTLGEFDRATQAHGLATSLGVVSATGIAGLTLSGGIGWLRRKYGMSCDNLLSAQVVTADGSIVTATENERSGLLWGLRGGGGNFGVVTSFEYRLHPVGPMVMFAFVFYPGERAAGFLRAHEDYMADAPDDVSTLAFLGTIPDAEMFPREAHGRPFLAFAAMYSGDAADGRQVLQPLREFGEPLVDLSGLMPYVEAQQILDDDYPDGWRYYWKSVNCARLTDELIERLISHARAAPSAYSTIDVWHHGGAMGRISSHETAFGARPPYLLAAEANWQLAADDEANVAWARQFVHDLRRFSEGGAYLNFPGFLEEGEQLIREAYGANYERLAALKAEYDPQNLFRVNQNIRPPAAA